MPKKRPPKNRRQRNPRQTALGSARSVDRYHQERDQILQRLEEGSALRQRREAFCQQLRDAGRDDHSTTALRRQRARKWDRKVGYLRALQQWVKAAADELKDAVLEAMNSVRDPGRSEGPLVRNMIGLSEMTTWLTAELSKERRIALIAANWHDRATPQKSTQWGPTTLDVVNKIVEKAKSAFGEGMDPALWNSPQQAAEYYAGLLCIEAGILRTANPEMKGKIAEIVRKRLDRGEPLRKVVEQERIEISQRFKT